MAKGFMRLVAAQLTMLEKLARATKVRSAAIEVYKAISS